MTYKFMFNIAMPPVHNSVLLLLCPTPPLFHLSCAPQSHQGHPHLRVHGGLPRRALPAAHLRAALPANDAPLHGDGHQEVWHVQL